MKWEVCGICGMVARSEFMSTVDGKRVCPVCYPETKKKRKAKAKGAKYDSEGNEYIEQFGKEA